MSRDYNKYNEQAYTANVMSDAKFNARAIAIRLHDMMENSANEVEALATIIQEAHDTGWNRACDACLTESPRDVKL